VDKGPKALVRLVSAHEGAMTLCRTILFAVAAASLALPAASAAQDDYAQPANLGPEEPGDFTGYAEFRGGEARILSQIDQALREDRITQREAQDFLDRLSKIQDDEARGFRFYGWRPPVDVRDKIRYALNHLSREIDAKAQY
jgi:hypothetical protein